MSGESFFRPDPLARMFRTECSECAFTVLTWCTPDRLVQLVPEHNLARVREMIEFLGAGIDCWFCPRCNAFGGMA